MTTADATADRRRRRRDDARSYRAGDMVSAQCALGPRAFRSFTRFGGVGASRPCRLCRANISPCTIHVLPRSCRGPAVGLVTDRAPWGSSEVATAVPDPSARYSVARAPFTISRHRVVCIPWRDVFTVTVRQSCEYYTVFIKRSVFSVPLSSGQTYSPRL